MPNQSNSSDSLFLQKLKTTTTGFEHDIFHNNLKGNLYGQIYSNLQIFQIATKIGIHHRPFGGDNFTSKISKNYPSWRHLLK